jgi:hypothetical protein
MLQLKDTGLLFENICPSVRKQASGTLAIGREGLFDTPKTMLMCAIHDEY